jgi:hypothetical protein
MRYFGTIRHADCEGAATPVGEPCSRCGESIVAGDRGVIMPHVHLDRPSTDQPLHYECFMRNIVGSVMHQQKLCRCFMPLETACEEDDPRLTKRQAAELATALWYYRQRPLNPRG